MNTVEPFAARKGTPVLPGVGRRLAIDPGKFTGWGLFSTTGFLIAAGVGEPPMAGTSDFGITRVVIEAPQIYPGGHQRPQDLIALAFMAGRLIGRAQSGPFPVEAKWVWPHEWKGSLPKSVCAARIQKKLTVDERAVMEECSRFVPAGQLNNVWDAVGIGLFAWRGGIS